MSSLQPSAVAFLAQLPLFRDLPAQDLKCIAAAATVRLYKKGQAVFEAGDEAKHLFVVVSGLVKESCVAEHGKERIIELWSDAQTFGEAALFQRQPYPDFATALADSQLMQIDGKALLDVADREPRLYQLLLERVSARILALYQDIEDYSLKSPAHRLASYLIEQSAGRTRVTLSASKQAIALRLGMSPEHLSRSLRELSESGVIAVQGNRIKAAKTRRFRFN